ncbi:MAG: DDE-type integrase/transposase/recombinase [Deltaproteobacteria bacterium]|nr:DDE-type integrase/transposase/recombinase [Deltaproteobacteria bacterium]
MSAEMIQSTKLAEILGISDRAVRLRAEKENWKYQQGPNRMKLYYIDSLPEDKRRRVIQARESTYIKGMVLPSRADLDLGQAKTLLKKFENAPEWSRKRAEARGEIVESFDRFTIETAQGAGRRAHGKKRNLTKAKNDFIRRYNVGNDGLGISGETYTVIDQISRGSLDRWRANKKLFGLAGLLDSTREKECFGKITPEMRAYIIGLKSKKIHTRPVRIYDYLVNKFGGPGVELPSDATVRRFIKNWETDNASLVAFLKNPDKWRSDYQAAFGDASEKAKYFLHMIEFDNTPADIMCADGKRYTVTGAIDIFSRKANCQIIPTAKSQAIANLLRWLILNWGLPDIAIMDNGQDYASKHIEAACGALGVDLDFTPPFTPEAKPHIERFFRSLSMSLFEELDGYIGHSVADRKAIESQKSFAQRMFNKDAVIEIRLMPDELQEIIDTWIEKIYHQRPHSSLGKSPEERAGESSQPVKRILDERVLDILLAPVGNPTVLKSGIHYGNGVYVAPELADYVREKVQIRRDLADAGKLYVFDMNSRFICIAKDAAFEGISVEEANIAKQRQKKRVREEVRALKALAKDVGDPMTELLESKRAAKGQKFGFVRRETFENDEIREAMKAIQQPEEPMEAEGWRLETESDGKVVKLHEEPIFQSGLERHHYLEAQSKIRNLTDIEIAWWEGYKSTEEYYRIFVMPYK